MLLMAWLLKNGGCISEKVNRHDHVVPLEMTKNAAMILLTKLMMVALTTTKMMAMMILTMHKLLTYLAMMMTRSMFDEERRMKQTKKPHFSKLSGSQIRARHTIQPDH